MTDDLDTVPENVTLQWIGRMLLALRQDLLRKQGLRDLKTDAVARASTFNAVSSEEFWALFQAHRALRDRVAALERK